ncbi:MAG TPA: hypothetical protein GX743_05505 [Actinomycetales bacterium]|nr:hypothetical protein [Actinomycetales bacterium]
MSTRASISQPNLAAIEAGNRPLGSVVEQRLAEALAARPSEILDRHRAALASLAIEYGIENVRVFGSVARGADHPGSDLDLLVTIPDTASPWALARFQRAAEELLSVDVDVVDDHPANTGAALHQARLHAVPL